MRRHYSLTNVYSQRGPENLSKLLAEVKFPYNIFAFVSVFLSKREWPYRSAFSKTQNDHKQILHYSQDQYNVGRSDDSAEGNLLYLQSANYKNMNDSSSLEDCDETCTY